MNPGASVSPAPRPGDEPNRGRDPAIAVVIPVFKQPEYLKDAIISAVRQEIGDRLRIVIVNDGCPYPSTDRLGRFFRDAFPQTVRYLRQRNGGLSSARNLGVRFALTAWPTIRAVFPLDADNRLSPHTLATLWQRLAEAPHDVGWAYQDHATFGSEDASWRVGVPFSAYRLIHENYCDAGSLIRREVFDAGIWYDEAMRTGYEDWEFFVNASLSGFRGIHVAETGFQYRVHGHSLLASARRHHEALAAFIANKHRDRLGHDELTRLEHTELPRFAVVIVDRARAFYATDLSAIDRHEVPVEAFVADVTAWGDEPRPEATYVPPVVMFAEQPVLDLLHDLRVLPGIAFLLQRTIGRVDYATVMLDFAGEPHTLELAQGTRTGEPILFAITPQQWGKLTDAFGDRAGKLIRRGELVSASMTLRVGSSFLSAAAPLLGRVTCVVAGAGASELRLVPGHGAGGVLDEAVRILGRIRGRRNRVPNRAGGSGDGVLLPSHAGFAHWRHVERKTSGFPSCLRPAREEGRAIVFAVPWLTLGGVDRCVLNLARELGRANPAHRLHLVLTSSNRIEADPEALRAFATVTFLPSDESDRRQALERLLTAADVVINAHSRVGYDLLPDLTRPGRTTWMSYLHVVDEDGAGRPVGYPLIAARQYGELIDHFLVISHQLRRWCLNVGVPGEKICLLPNAPTVRPQTDAAALAIAAAKGRRTYSSDDPVRILYSGRFDRQKGVDRLGQIATGLARRRVPFDLTLLGKTVFASTPPSLAMPGVRVLPATVDDRELARRYAEADVLILPSRWEGIPLAVLEAMAFGTIVVATRVGAVDEVVVDGTTGFLVDPEQSDAGIADAFVDTIAGVASSPRAHEHIRLAACRAALDLSWERSAATLGSLIGAAGRGVAPARIGADE
jgi:glycosyltransferase involved in cell wall biosynthesis/GT2 family glycosyltransferase